MNHKDKSNIGKGSSTYHLLPLKFLNYILKTTQEIRDISKLFKEMEEKVWELKVITLKKCKTGV